MSQDPFHDARIAAALHHLPSFRRWRGERLPLTERRGLDRYDDEQRIMSAVVELLSRLARRR